jgi:hypothetical protein
MVIVALLKGSKNENVKLRAARSLLVQREGINLKQMTQAATERLKLP